MSKLLSIIAVPAAFVAAFVLAFVLMGVADAVAQPAQPELPAETPTPTETETGSMPDHGFAPPSDDAPPTGDEVVDEAGEESTGQLVPGTDIHGNAQGPAGVDDSHAAPGAGHHDPSEHFNFLGGPFEHVGKDATGGKFGDGRMTDPHTGQPMLDSHGRPIEEPMSAPFIFMVLNFAILMFLLIWKGGPVATKLAVDRHDQIKTALDEAAKLRKQAQDKLSEYETRLKDADAEIRTLVEGIRTDAEADKARIIENAAKQSALMKRDAELRIAAEIELARAVLTREVTAAASVATEKLLREKMMPGDQQKLVGSFITDIKSAESPKERA